MIRRAREYLDAEGMPGLEMLRSVVAEHLSGLERLKKLQRYYRGQNAILSRRRAEGLPNNRMAHAFARYIVAVTTGYLVGGPVRYEAGESPTLREIQRMLRRCSAASVDAENARNAAIYGRGVELVHADADLAVRITALSPMDAFVVYDDGCDMRPMFGVACARKARADGQDDGWRVWVLGRARVDEYRCRALAGSDYVRVGASPHYFGDVPLVEYWNDENETGDFEWVLPQIDGYDKLQSDRVNDKEQFVDALLVLVGCTLDTDERGRSPGQQLREDKALCLPDGQASAYYLHNAMDEAGNQILRDNLAVDIHKLSMVPDLSDENFAANASGVAMRYKLWGLEQLTRVKEQWFLEGLRSRLALLAHFLQVRGCPPLDVGEVSIHMQRALPANLAELTDNIRLARDCGAMSVQEAVRALHAPEDWSEAQVAEEVERIGRSGKI